MTTKKITAVLVGAALVAALVVGIARAAGTDVDATPEPAGTALPSISQGPTPPPGGPATPSVDPTAGLEAGDGYEESSSPLPTNEVTGGGGDHDEDTTEVPADQIEPLLDRSTEFWAAFSIRDPGDRDDALADVAVPYLAERMSVSTTDRIPEVEPVQAAVTYGSYTTAYVITEDQTGQWWALNLVVDPADDLRWYAQTYELAAPGQIADAQRILDE